MASHKGVGSLRSNSSQRAAIAGSMTDPCTTRTRPVSTVRTAIFEKDAPAAAASCSARAAATSAGDAAPASALARRQMPSSGDNVPTGRLRERDSSCSDITDPRRGVCDDLAVKAAPTSGATLLREVAAETRAAQRDVASVRRPVRGRTPRQDQSAPGGSRPTRRSRRPARYPAGRRESKAAASVRSGVAASRPGRRCPNCR